MTNLFHNPIGERNGKIHLSSPSEYIFIFKQIQSSEIFVLYYSHIKPLIVKDFMIGFTKDNCLYCRSNKTVRFSF